MTKQKIILEITHQNSNEIARYESCAHFPITIGRGYHNDIIIADPHVSADHAELRETGGMWILHDLDSENGLQAEGRRGKSLPLRSGDVIRLGQTDIRFYEPRHPVPTAVTLQKEHPLFEMIAKPTVVWWLFCLTIAATCGWSYLEIWTKEISSTLSKAAAVVAGIILLWSLPWALAGRLLRHRASFTGHVGIFCCYILASAFLWYVQSYIDFFTSEGTLSIVTNYAFNLLLLTLLVYYTLALATNMTRVRRRNRSILFSVGLLGLFLVMSYLGERSFDAEPRYAATLEPYGASLAPTESLPEFLSKSGKIFGRIVIPVPE